jgi:NAD(P)H-dependent FMN reductase
LGKGWRDPSAPPDGSRQMTRILVITGTTRDGRFSERVATWVTGRLAGRGDLEIDLLDLAVLKNAMDHWAGALARVRATG